MHTLHTVVGYGILLCMPIYTRCLCFDLEGVACTLEWGVPFSWYQWESWFSMMQSTPHIYHQKQSLYPRVSSIVVTVLVVALQLSYFEYFELVWVSVCFILWPTLPQQNILVIDVSFSAEFGVGQICSSCRGCPHWWGPEGCPLQALWPVWLVEPGQTPRCLVPRLGRATTLGNGRFSVYYYKQ